MNFLDKIIIKVFKIKLGISEPEKISVPFKLDIYDPTIGTAILAVVLMLFGVLLEEYMGVTIVIPVWMFVVGILTIFIIPVLFIKYYYMELIKWVPELKLFIDARKNRYPLVQEWNDVGYFVFKKADISEISGIPRTYTIRGLEVYQKLVTEKKNLYKEAFQNISTIYSVPDIQTFRQCIEILKKQKADHLLWLIIMGSVGLFIILLGLGIFLRLNGKA